MVFYPFELTAPHIIYACLGGFIVLFGMFSLFLRERLYISEACWAFLFGVIIGPYCADIFNPRAWAHDEEAVNVITLEFTRVILAVGVFAIGVELPKAYMKRHWKSLFFLLVPVMTWGWLVSAAFIYALIPGLNFLTSLAVAACLTPTDPILAAAVIGGKWADKHVPAHIRHLLAAESGCNDGAAFPFLFLSLYLLLDHPNTGVAIRDWFLLLWLYQVVLGVILGAAIGIAFRYLMKFCERMDLIDRHSYVAQYLSLAMFTIGVCTLLGSDDLLAAFACGTAFAWDGFFNRQTEESVFSSVIDLLFNIAAFVYLGAWMPFNKFQDAELTLSVWRLLVIAILVLLFRRLPIMIAVYKWIPDVKNFREAVFCGHFGPMGIGAVFISTLTLEIIHRAHKTEENASNYHQIEMLVETIHPIVGFMVLTSITVHGLSIPSFSLGRRVHSVSRTWSRHATGQSLGGTPEWAHHTTLVTRGDEKIVINRDDGRRPLEIDVERGSDSDKTKEGSGHSIEAKDYADEPESSTAPPDRLEIKIDSPRDVKFQDLENKRRSANLHLADLTPLAKVYTPPSRYSIPMQEMTSPAEERMTGRGGDTEEDTGETVSEWKEGHQTVIERKRGPGEDPEVTVIRDPNSPSFGENLGQRVSQELQSIAGGIQRQRSRLGSDVRVRRRQSGRNSTSPSGSHTASTKGKQRAHPLSSPQDPSPSSIGRTPPNSPPPHIMITGDDSEEDDGWASEDNEDGGKAEKPKSRRAKIAHFMGRKKRRGSFRGGREGAIEGDGSKTEVSLMQEEEDVRGRGRAGPISPAHRRLGSDFSGGLTVDSARRVGTRESSPARSVRFQEGGRSSYLKHESQKSG